MHCTELYFDGDMKREEAINLLKEILGACESFKSAQAVLVAKDEKKESYNIRAKWDPETQEKRCLEEIALRYGIEISVEDGYTVFHK